MLAFGYAARETCRRACVVLGITAVVAAFPVQAKLRVVTGSLTNPTAPTPFLNPGLRASVGMDVSAPRLGSETRWILVPEAPLAGVGTSLSLERESSLLKEGDVGVLETIREGALVLESKEASRPSEEARAEKGLRVFDGAGRSRKKTGLVIAQAPSASLNGPGGFLRPGGLSINRVSKVEGKSELPPVPGKQAGVRPGRLAGMRRALSAPLRSLGRMALGFTKAFRDPDWSEDRRINRAIAALAGSPVGSDVYRYVYENYPSLTIHIDDNPRSVYDARLQWHGDRPILWLTENLVDREHTEVIASYIVRELSDLYYDSFPASVERTYLSASTMLRTFAELTNSGTSDWFGQMRWNYRKEQYDGNTPVFLTRYQSWKDALVRTDGFGDVREHDWFRFLQRSDDSNVDPESKRTLRQRYDRGEIDWDTLLEMDAYFQQVVGSERDWAKRTNRWN